MIVEHVRVRRRSSKQSENIERPYPIKSNPVPSAARQPSEWIRPSRLTHYDGEARATGEVRQGRGGGYGGELEPHRARGAAVGGSGLDHGEAGRVVHLLGSIHMQDLQILRFPCPVFPPELPSSGMPCILPFSTHRSRACALLHFLHVLFERTKINEGIHDSREEMKKRESFFFQFPSVVGFIDWKSEQH